MDHEPDYIAQTAEPEHLTPDGFWAWRRRCAEEAMAMGCTHGRYSVDDSAKPTMALVEGWKVRPDDEGPIRWQMTSAPNAD